MRMWSAIRVGFLSALLCTACDDEGPDTSTDDESNTTGETGETGTSGAATTGAPACMSDEDCGGTDVCSTEGECVPGAANWAVGGDGLVVRLSPDAGATVHPLELQRDLHAISCFERSKAWFVGDEGVIGYTGDAGASWRLLDAPSSLDLLDVATTEPLRVAVAGAEGTLLVSENGLDFAAIAGPSSALHGVEVTSSRVLAVAESGAVWRHEFGAETAVKTGQAEVALRAIDLGDHGSFGAAVGLQGAMLWTEDGGVTWTKMATGTSLDLYAVQVAMNGSKALAVGAEGVVVRVEAGEVTTTQVASVDLRALHLSSDGFGAVVGAEGTALFTENAGRDFQALQTGLFGDIEGVDALGELHW